jgi:hypothetical protein
LSQFVGNATRRTRTLPELRRRGCRGIEIDRFGYPDNASAVEAELWKRLVNATCQRRRHVLFFELSS